jgi:hypothetical protein
LASWTARLIALRDSAEPSVGTRIFLNMFGLLLPRFDPAHAVRHRLQFTPLAD